MKQPAALRIGQLIFDPNGEYANENAQDSGRRDVANVASINRKRVAAYTIGAPLDRRGGPLLQSTRSASAG